MFFDQLSTTNYDLQDSLQSLCESEGLNGLLDRCNVNRHLLGNYCFKEQDFVLYECEELKEKLFSEKSRFGNFFFFFLCV